MNRDLWDYALVFAFLLLCLVVFGGMGYVIVVSEGFSKW